MPQQLDVESRIIRRMLRALAMLPDEAQRTRAVQYLWARRQAPWGVEDNVKRVKYEGHTDDMFAGLEPEQPEPETLASDLLP